MRTYYPETEPFNHFFLEVDNTHQLYVEEHGNPNGIPVIINHGGPGAGSAPEYACYFNPKDYHIILYDQRGAGKSTPTSSLENNETNYLVQDIELLRKKLNLDRVVVFGGSWGATLSVLYAQAYPENILSIILRGIYLGRKQDTRAFLTENSQAAKDEPEEWIKFKAHVFPQDPEKERTYEEISQAYLARVRDSDPNIWKPAARAFAHWESVNACKDPVQRKEELKWAETDDALNMGRIEVYYLCHDCFMGKETRIQDDLMKLPKVPIYITTGQQDTICPPAQTRILVEHLKKLGHQHVTAEFPDNTGHSGSDPGNVDALIRFTEHYAESYHLYKKQQSSAQFPQIGFGYGGNKSSEKTDNQEGSMAFIP